MRYSHFDLESSFKKQFAIQNRPIATIPSPIPATRAISSSSFLAHLLPASVFQFLRNPEYTQYKLIPNDNGTIIVNTEDRWEAGYSDFSLIMHKKVTS